MASKLDALRMRASTSSVVKMHFFIPIVPKFNCYYPLFKSQTINHVE